MADYMEGTDCGDIKHLGSAVVYSQLVSTGEYYPHDVECKMTFKAEDDGWRLMVRILELDIQDRTVNGFCNDALYVYDDSTILAKAVVRGLGLFSSVFCMFLCVIVLNICLFCALYVYNYTTILARAVVRRLGFVLVCVCIFLYVLFLTVLTFFDDGGTLKSKN